MMKTLRTTAFILLSLFLAGCSIFSPISLEQHQWGSLILHDGYKYASQEHSNSSWEFTYEQDTIRTFSGLVRHTSRINENQYPMLTHDILVTSGDFSDPSLVRTSVSNQRFMWSATSMENPKGSINLLHTMPIDEATLNQLYAVRYGDTVVIKGYEIYTIEHYKDGNYRGMWKDAGCNTLLVTEVIIQPSP